MGKLIERTEGRRKGYQRYTSRVKDRVRPDVLEKLEAIRKSGSKPVRKP